ncbi:hypothetical protein [Jiella pelagia]|uniref:Uncharacterized protein n=1 Tax=Jiella pelagia TaxID=2986949 RepID=A0ABY7C715_9HYPH|nr:hypothetical protein [Jiella pelagia]WAP70849.1 hypothetical protein OH818_13145 [Jiella pelagia]
MAGEKLTITLEGSTAKRLRALCDASGHPPEVYLEVMLEDHFDSEIAEIRELQERLQNAEAGNVIPHEEAREQLRRTIAQASRDAAE